MKHLNLEELEAGLEHIRQAPKDNGELQLIVARPKENERKILEEGQLDLEIGLVGDSWIKRPSSKMPNGLPHPEKQINIMNARSAALVAQSKERWSLAGDQLYIDMDLSDENLRPGSRVSIGTAVLEITALPHNGCKKFVERFGLEAMRFVNSSVGKELHLRGINAKVVEPGTIKQGDRVVKV
jgi:MOSC domain-containing protein YiiM